MKSFGHPVFWLASDAANSDVLYASVIHFGGTQGSQQGGIYMATGLTSPASANWTKLPNPPRTEGHPCNIVVLKYGNLLCSFSGRRDSKGAFTASAGVFVYDQKTKIWTDKSDAGMKYWTHDVLIDPSDTAQKTWYTCVYSGWGGAPNGLGGLYKTTDAGSTWTRISGTLFDRVSSVTFSPKDPETVYLSTETQGLWICNNIHAATPTWKNVDAYDFRQPMRIFFNPYNSDELWVSSFGNGMKMGNLKNGSAGFAPALNTLSSRLMVYPNPVKDILFLSLDNASHPGGEADYCKPIETGTFPNLNTGYLLNVISSSGQIIASYSCAKLPCIVPVSQLQAGLSFIKISKQTGLKTESFSAKFIIGRP